jgi:hypothetical protein
MIWNLSLWRFRRVYFFGHPSLDIIALEDGHAYDDHTQIQHVT